MFTREDGFLDRFVRGEIEPDSAYVEPVQDWPVVTLSSPTLMPPPPVVPVTQLARPTEPTVMPVLISQLGDTTNMDTTLPPGVSPEALALLRQHGVAHDSEWLWRAGAYPLADLQRMLGEMAPSTAAADLLRQYGVEGNSEWVWRATQYDIGSLGRLLAESFPAGHPKPIGGNASLPSLVSQPSSFAPLPQVGGLESWVKSVTETAPPSSTSSAPGLPLPMLLAGAAAALLLL